MTHSAGRFIALEGIDGSGTTSQARRIVERLVDRGQRAAFTCEPSGHPIGRLLREVLRHEQRCTPATTALLFAADRLEHVEGEVRPACAEGTHVISDRYVYSSLAYQSLHEPMAWVAEVNAKAPEPDLTIYVRVTPEVAAERRQLRGEADELFDALELQRKIAGAYDALLGDAPCAPAPRAVHGRQPLVAVVDGDGPFEVVAEALDALIDDALPPLEESP